MTLVHNASNAQILKTYNQSTREAQPLGLHHGDDAAPHSPAYDHFETELNAETGTFWCHMRPHGKPIVTHGLLTELSSIQRGLQSMFAGLDPSEPQPFSYFVFASRTPGVFNLGGDLSHFVESVRAGNRETIHRYARSCVEIVHQNVHAFHLPVITMALVQGDALGGGFETALSFDMIVAERSAKFCLPEILFNLFPGMGAYSLISRKLDAARAQRLIASGEMFTAVQLHEMGLVDILAEDGQGEAVVAQYIRKNLARHSGHYAMNLARRRVNPVTLDELRDIVDVWTDAVFRLSDLNLRKMERLSNAQSKRMSRAAFA